MGKKYYAVRVGRKPGIYLTWDECRLQTDGFSGAEFKSFGSQAEARAFLGTSASQGSAPTPAAKRGGAGGSRLYYAIAKGEETGIFTCKWPEIQHLVDGYPKAMYSKFKTVEEAMEFMRDYGGFMSAALEIKESPIKRRKSTEDSVPAPPPAFRPQQSTPQPPEQPQQQPASGNKAATVPNAVSAHDDRQVTVYFDGGSRKNPGRAGYGYAIYDSSTGKQLRLGCRAITFGSTNNQAEYSGLVEGMKFAIEQLGARRLLVRGDSELLVRQMTGRYKVNSDKIKDLYQQAKALSLRCSSFKIEHVYREDNKVADRLSNLAMDTDLALDDIGVMAQRGDTDRAAVVQTLASAAGIEADTGAINKLRQAASFLDATADLLSALWDMPEAEAKEILLAKDWTAATGGPPIDALPNSSSVSAATAGPARSARGMHTVAVAAVTLGDQWGMEIGRQEQLIRQQQQQGAVSSSQAGDGGSSSGAAAQQQLHRFAGNRPASTAAAGMHATWLRQGQQQQQRSRHIADASLLSNRQQPDRLTIHLPCPHSQQLLGANRIAVVSHMSRTASALSGSRTNAGSGFMVSAASAAVAAGRLYSRRRGGGVAGFLTGGTCCRQRAMRLHTA